MRTKNAALNPPSVSYTHLASENAAFLTIHSDDPEGFKGIDPAKMALWSKSVSLACKPFYDSLDLGINTWCIVASSSLKWANKVYPDMSDDEAVEALSLIHIF